MGSFGERLRREREMRGVSLDDIAEGTKIGTRLLRALEEEHFELLPGGIFNKGFVRAYAKYLGLNEEEAVSDYLEAAGETVPDPRVIAEQNSSRIDRSGSDASASRQAGFPVVPVVILTLVIAAGAGGWQIYQERVRDREAKRQATSSGLSTPAANPTPAPTSPATGVTPSTPSEPTASQVGGPGASTGTANTASTQPFEVTVRAKDSAWVSIKSDGKFIVRGIIGPPDVKTIHANNEIIFWTGNAGAVEVSFNGQPVPLAGGPNQVSTVVFNSQGVVPPKPAQ